MTLRYITAAAVLAIAALLVRWRHWAPAVLAACFGVCTLGAFTLAATVGLYGTHEHWEGFYVWAAAIAELVAIAGALAILLEDPVPAAPRPRGGRRRAETPQRTGRAKSGVSS